jgi:excisionase family DNA binding protein
MQKVTLSADGFEADPLIAVLWPITAPTQPLGTGRLQTPSVLRSVARQRKVATSAPVVEGPNRGPETGGRTAGRKTAPGRAASEEPLLVKTTTPRRNARRGVDDGEGFGSLFDYEAAARYLCTTPRHVRELWAKRQLAAIKVGRCVRFTKGDLDAFIAAKSCEHRSIEAKLDPVGAPSSRRRGPASRPSGTGVG